MTTELSREELEFLASCFDLAREGDADRLGDYLDQGLPANLTNDSGDTLLILGAYYKQLPVVRTLLAHGADTTRINDRGQTALASAVFRQDEPIVRALLAAGADPALGPQSAYAIAEYFDLPHMRALLDGERSEGDQGDAKQADGKPSDGRRDDGQRAGDGRDSQGRSGHAHEGAAQPGGDTGGTGDPASDASAAGPRATARRLTAEEMEHFGAVFDFARSGRVDAIVELLDAGLPVDVANASGDTMLILATYAQQHPVVTELLARGANVDHVNDRGQTALHCAIIREDEALLRALLAAGADTSRGARSAQAVAEFFDLPHMRALLDRSATGPTGN